MGFFLGLTKVKCEAQGPFGKQLHNEKLHFVCSFFYYLTWLWCEVSKNEVSHKLRCTHGLGLVECSVKLRETC